MPTNAQIQAKINFGVGKVGTALGLPYSWYRPSLPGVVIQPGNLLGTVLAHISASPALTPAPSALGKPDRYAAFNPTLYLAGDYLVGAETYFLAEQMPLAGVSHLVLCNETFTLSRRGETTPGADFFAGGLQANSIIASGFPGWIKSGDRRQPSDLHQPGEVNMATVNIFLPTSISNQILRGDELNTSDTIAARWIVQSADLSSNGWSIIAVLGGAVNPSNLVV